MKNKILSGTLFFLSVVFFALSQPSLLFEDGLSFCAWLSYIPFFLLTERICIRASWLWGAVFGAVAYFCLCWWLSAFGAVAISFVCALFAFYHAILFFLIAFSQRIFPAHFGRFFWFFRVFLVLCVEFLRTHGIFGFSYGIIGYSQWKNPAFLRFSSLFGVMGVSFVILLVNSLVAKIISEKNIRENLRELSVCLSIIAGILAFWGIASLFSQKNSAESLQVALIQNASSAKSRTISDFEKDAVLLKKLTDDALRHNPQTNLVVWAETAIVPDIVLNLKNSSDKRRNALAQNLVSYIASKNCAFLIGNNHSDENGTHNSALYFSADFDGSDVEKIGAYSKNHLVPFTEYWLDFLDFPIFDGIKESLDCEFFDAGRGIDIFAIDGLHFSTPICFEDSFAPLIREMKKGGADFFVNISDDAWAGQNSAQKMHLSMSAFRCAEFRTPMIRSTIDGKTCIINENGKVTAEIKSGIDGFLCAEVRIPANSRTPYLFFGDTLMFILCVLTALCMLILSVLFCKMKVYGRR